VIKTATNGLNVDDSNGYDDFRKNAGLDSVSWNRPIILAFRIQPPSNLIGFHQHAI